MVSRTLWSPSGGGPGVQGKQYVERGLKYKEKVALRLARYSSTVRECRRGRALRTLLVATAS